MAAPPSEFTDQVASYGEQAKALTKFLDDLEKHAGADVATKVRYANSHAVACMPSHVYPCPHTVAHVPFDMHTITCIPPHTYCYKVRYANAAKIYGVDLKGAAAAPKPITEAAKPPALKKAMSSVGTTKGFNFIASLAYGA